MQYEILNKIYDKLYIKKLRRRAELKRVWEILTKTLQD